MGNKVVSIKEKSKILIRYAKECNIRDAATLGLIFRLWSDLEILSKAIFLSDLSLIMEEPVLIIGQDTSTRGTVLTANDVPYNNLNSIIDVLQSCNYYYVFLDFPDNKIPSWYLQCCEKNPFIEAMPSVTELIEEARQNFLCAEAFQPVYQEALQILIDEALDKGDKKRFRVLVKELKKV